MTPAVVASVVVVTYNRPDHVRRCLEHLEAQTLRPVRTIVVDASPDDRTSEVVAAFPEVVYLRNPRGRGSTATSRAIGLAEAYGDVVAFLDDDAFAHPDWLYELIRRYSDPLVAAVGGRASNGVAGEESQGLAEIGLLLPNGKLTGNFAADPGRDVDVDHMLGANMSVRLGVVRLLGGIRDNYPGTCLREETDIALRMRRAGYRIVYTPSAVVEHVAGPYARGRRFDTRYTYFGARNHVVLLVTTLGARSTYVRNYAATVALDVARELRTGVAALSDDRREGAASRLRGFGGGVLRAGVKAAGTFVGAVAAVGARTRTPSTSDFLGGG